MKLLIKEPKVTEYCFRLEPSDELFINCQWARFLLNHDTYVLSIESDCGTFSYGWSVTESEPFKKLMARIDKWYLMSKFSNMTELNLEKSKSNTINNLKNNSCWFSNLSKPEQKEIINEIKDICTNNEEIFYSQVSSATSGRIDWEYIDTDKDYPLRTRVICDFFEKYLQPELRK